ncbi:hypothetical protein CsSME_00030903 [Camellia sinensis var. sinensis]
MLSIPVNLPFTPLASEQGQSEKRIITRTKVVWAASMTHMDETIFPNPSNIDPTLFEQQARSPPYSVLWHSEEDQECVLGMSSPQSEIQCQFSIRGYRFMLSQRNLKVRFEVH